MRPRPRPAVSGDGRSHSSTKSPSATMAMRTAGHASEGGPAHADRVDRRLSVEDNGERSITASRSVEPSGEAGGLRPIGRMGMVPMWPSRRPRPDGSDLGALGRDPRPSQARFSKEILRKEVIQPQVPLRLPCYDLVPITGFIFGACLAAPTTSDAPRFGGLTGGVYKAQEHIHRRSADRRLLAIPASCGRVAARNPNWGTIFAISAALRPGDALSVPL